MITQGLGPSSFMKVSFFHFLTYVNTVDIIISIKKAMITAERMIRSEYLLFNSLSINAVVSFWSLKSDKAPPSLSLVKLN